MQRVLLVLITSFFTFALAGGAYGADFTVNTTGDTADAAPGNGMCADAGGMCSLRAAIGEANALAGDDTINVPAGTYTQTLVAANEDANAGGDWDITSNVTITGAGAATTILQAAATPGSATERVMESTLAGNVVIISGVTLRHGNKTGAPATATRGGGIRNVGTLTMNDSVVTLNNASGAGGVRNERTISLNNVTVSNNNCNNTTATCFGGGMYNTLAALSTVTITNCTFTGNMSTATGTNGFGFAAGLGIESATGFNLVMSGSTFSNNVGVGNGTGGSNGNGIRVLSTSTSTANITNSSFNGHSGTGGAAIQGVGIQAFTSGTGTLTGTWDGLTVNGNSGIVGAGVALVPTGGAMTLTIRNSTISNNTSTTAAAGLIFSNSGQTSGAASSITLTNSTISGNTANGAGGGVFVEQPGTGTVTASFNFSTIANNRANNDNSGADSGGGIARVSGTVNLKNTVVGDNSFGTGATGPDIFGTVNSQDYNHIEDLTGATISGTTTNNTTGDAALGPLANNGGPTLTHLPGAPVLNSIPNGVNDCGTAVTVDQRQLPRPAGGACEKGSVEVQVAAGPFDLGGQVLTSTGAGIRNVRLRLTGGSLPAPLEVQTSSFGYYNFVDVPAGSYTLTIISKRFTFATPSVPVNLNADIQNQNFTANPGLAQERVPSDQR